MGKPTDPDYWRKWRAAHPEYTERERARRKASRASGTPRDRTAEYQSAKTKRAEAAQAKKQRRAWNRKGEARRKAKLLADPEALDQRRNAMRKYVKDSRSRKGPAPSGTAEGQAETRARKWLHLAHTVVSERTKQDLRDVVYDPLFEDAISVAVLAIYSKSTHQRTLAAATKRAEDAVDAFLKSERSWRFFAAPLLDEVLRAK